MNTTITPLLTSSAFLDKPGTMGGILPVSIHADAIKALDVSPLRAAAAQLTLCQLLTEWQAHGYWAAIAARQLGEALDRVHWERRQKHEVMAEEHTFRMEELAAGLALLKGHELIESNPLGAIWLVWPSERLIEVLEGTSPLVQPNEGYIHDV